MKTPAPVAVYNRLNLCVAATVNNSLHDLIYGVDVSSQTWINSKISVGLKYVKT